MNDTADMLARLRAGEDGAQEALIELMYPHLRRLAAARLRGRGRNVTLDTTSLVHETYLRLAGQRQSNWQNRAHFMAIAASVMRRVVVDHARNRKSQKRGGGAVPVTLADAPARQEASRIDWLVLHDALEALSEINPLAARVVELKYFAGMTQEEMSEALNISRATVTRRWRFARAWLRPYLEGEQENDA